LDGSSGSRAPWILAAALTAATVALVTALGSASVGRRMRVCADPNNLPFSNERGEGFENTLAQLVADEMRADVEYTWFAQRRGFVRHTLRAGLCDVIMGVPTSFELARATRPYYRSSYVFVYRDGRGLDIRSLDDAILKSLRIGVHIIGDDYANVPPAHALAARGIVNNVVGYSIYGNYAEADPPARLIAAVANGEVDVAVAWGPLAGYAAKKHDTPLRVVPVSPEIDLPFRPFVFDISMGVRHDDPDLQEELDRILQRNAERIDGILDHFGVPYTKRVRR
jgi:quinoprotein dehydrogenase-associated probable ABC transporter substrate-binding protein